MPKKRIWVPVKRAGLFVSSIHGKDEKTGFTIIHDSIQGWGFVSKSGKTISWHSGWKPQKRRKLRKLEPKKSITVLYPAMGKTLPSLNISELIKVQPMMA